MEASPSGAAGATTVAGPETSEPHVIAPMFAAGRRREHEPQKGSRTSDPGRTYSLAQAVQSPREIRSEPVRFDINNSSYDRVGSRVRVNIYCDRGVFACKRHAGWTLRQCRAHDNSSVPVSTCYIRQAVLGWRKNGVALRALPTGRNVFGLCSCQTSLYILLHYRQDPQQPSTRGAGGGPITPIMPTRSNKPLGRSNKSVTHASSMIIDTVTTLSPIGFIRILVARFHNLCHQQNIRGNLLPEPTLKKNSTSIFLPHIDHTHRSHLPSPGWPSRAPPRARWQWALGTFAR